MNRILTNLEDFIMKPRILFAGIVTCLLTFGSVLTYAASEGDLDATSTGTIEITAAIGHQVKITMLDDIDLGRWLATDTNDLTGNDDVCVYSSASNYRVNVSSYYGVSEFLLKDDSNNSIEYGVTWATYNQDAVDLTQGVEQAGRHGDPSSVTCATTGGSTNATIAITVPQPNLVGKPVGIYSDTLTVLISPQ